MTFRGPALLRRANALFREIPGCPPLRDHPAVGWPSMPAWLCQSASPMSPHHKPLMNSQLNRTRLAGFTLHVSRFRAIESATRGAVRSGRYASGAGSTLCIRRLGPSSHCIPIFRPHDFVSVPAFSAIVIIRCSLYIMPWQLHLKRSSSLFHAPSAAHRRRLAGCARARGPVDRF